jgi:hypothetical protein
MVTDHPDLDPKALAADAVVAVEAFSRSVLAS